MWCAVQTTEYDCWVIMYIMVCMHHKLHSNERPTTQLSRDIYIYIYIYIYIHIYIYNCWKKSKLKFLQNGCLHDVRDASLVCESSQFLTAWRLVLSMKPWSYIWLEFGLFSTIIAIIRACACWALFVVTLTNTVHLILYIYICIYIYIYEIDSTHSVMSFASHVKFHLS